MIGSSPPDSADATYSDYVSSLQAVMLDFQFMEEGLRRYISIAYALIRSKNAGTVPFRLTEKDIAKDSLGILLRKVSQLSDNTSLCAQIEKLLPVRNQIAHKGLLITHQISAKQESFDGLSANLMDMLTETRPCVKALIDEVQKLERIMASVV
jgi:hypothetical protein